MLALLLLAGCSDGSGDRTPDVDGESTLKGRSTFPIGNVVYLDDDARFTEYRSDQPRVAEIMREEVDYVGHDEVFRIRETHPGPSSTRYERLDAFVDDAEARGYRLHGHNLLFYADIGADHWIARYRRDGTWSREQWLAWFEQYVRGKVGRYKGRVASWDVLNEPLPKVLADDPQARNIFVDLAGPEIYAKVFRWAREADPDAKLVLNEYLLGPNGSAQVDDLIALADEIGRNGGKVDVIGFEGIYMFSPMLYTSYSYNYECFRKAADAGYMVSIQELNVALNTLPAAGRFQSQTRLLHSIQRKAFNDIVNAYMDAVPEQQRWGIATWGVPDYAGFTRFGEIFKLLRASGGGSEWPLLWSDMLDRKPAYYGFASALKGVREPFRYRDVDAEEPLRSDEPLSQNFKADLLAQLEEERIAASRIPGASATAQTYYDEVRREIEGSPEN